MSLRVFGLSLIDVESTLQCQQLDKKVSQQKKKKESYIVSNLPYVFELCKKTLNMQTDRVTLGPRPFEPETFLLWGTSTIYSATVWTSYSKILWWSKLRKLRLFHKKNLCLKGNSNISFVYLLSSFPQHYVSLTIFSLCICMFCLCFPVRSVCSRLSISSWIRVTPYKRRREDLYEALTCACLCPADTVVQ